MSVFYDLKGNPIKRDEFVEYYEKFYYNDCPVSINGVRQSSRFIEEHIEEILKTGITSELDVVRILAWKTGKISHRKSEKCREFFYCESWGNPENDVEGLLKKWGLELKSEGLVQYVIEKSKNISKWSNDIATSVLTEMGKRAPRGIGTVYLITLLYFMSRGEYPIYDQYADRAVTAIYAEVKPGTSVKSVEFPDRTYKNLGEKVLDPKGHYLGEYKRKIVEIFGSYDMNYRYKREIDRALWVYGHMFYSTFCSNYENWFKDCK